MQPKSSSSSNGKKEKSGKATAKVDFTRLSLSSLKKYRRHHHIRVKPTVPKAELAAAITTHFTTIPEPNEQQVINGFMEAVRKNQKRQAVAQEKQQALAAVILQRVEKEGGEMVDAGGRLQYASNSVQSNTQKTHNLQ